MMPVIVYQNKYFFTHKLYVLSSPFYGYVSMNSRFLDVR